MPDLPQDFSEPGLGVDTRIHNDDSYATSTGIQRLWRRQTPPAGEDGSIPSISLLAEGQVGHALVTNEQVDVSFKNPLHPSTFDIPNSEMQ